MFRFRELPPDFTQTHSFLGIQRHGAEMMYQLADRIMSERLYKNVQVDPVHPNERHCMQLPVQINMYRPHTWWERRLCPCKGNGHKIVDGAVHVYIDTEGENLGHSIRFRYGFRRMDFMNEQLRRLVEEFNEREGEMYVRPEGEPLIHAPDPLWTMELERRLHEYLEGLDKKRGNTL